MKYIYLLILSFFFISCAGEQVVQKYYILDISAEKEEGEPPLATFATLPYAVEIMPFNISGAYDQPRIALRTSSHELNYYFYHNWAENPGALVTHFVWKTLSGMKLFRTLEPNIFNLRPDYEITGSIDQIERTDIEDQYAAHLKMKLELREPLTGKTIVSHSFDRYREIGETTRMNVFAGEISSILADECRVFAGKVNIKLRASEDPADGK